MTSPMESYLHQMTCSDGSEFEKIAFDLAELKELHAKIALLTECMNELLKG